MVSIINTLTTMKKNNFIEMEFLPDKLKGQRIYEPGNNSKEIQMREFLKSRWKDKYGY